MKYSVWLRHALLLVSFLSLLACGGGNDTPAPTLSDNADLSSLVISSGSLSPTFRADTTSYVVDSVIQDSIGITATLADSNSSFTINGISATSGVLSPTINLTVGSNNIDIVVTAEDGTTTKTYTITVNRSAPASNNADLSALAASAGTLSPAFDSNTTSYTVNVANAVTSTTLTATTAETLATLMTNGVSETSGVESAAINLIIGANPIDVVVTAADGVTMNTYTVTVIRTGQRGDLESVTAQSSYDQATLAGLANAPVLFATNQVNIVYGVDTYKIDYWTVDPTGDPLLASGLLAVPQKMAASNTALLSYQHGTIFHDSEAPTNNAYYNELAALLASMDYIVTMPDYIGYGTSLAELHTYMHAESLANTTIDLLRAAKAWLNNNSIGINNQLFLAGYSEGGYATVATHRTMQQQYPGEFTVTAAAPATGAYDMYETANTFLNAATLPFAANIAFAFKAYDDIYGFNRISDIFQAPYVDPANNYFYGNHTIAEVDAAFTNVNADLFTATFLNDFRGMGEIEIKNRLTENNVYDWTPQSPIRFYHGQDDPIVPYTNSVTAQSVMTANSAGASDVLVVDCPAIPADHAYCYYPYLDYMAGYFLSF